MLFAVASRCRQTNVVEGAQLQRSAILSEVFRGVDSVSRFGGFGAQVGVTPAATDESLEIWVVWFARPLGIPFSLIAFFVHSF